MKKFFTLFIIGILFSGSTFAMEYSCPSNYMVHSGFSKFISNVTGSNFLYTKVLESALQKQAKKEFKGNFDIKLKSFSKKDLKEGKFKSLTATGENIKIDNFSVSKVSLNSLCPYNQIIKNANSKYEFATDFPVDVKFELSAEDINQIKEFSEFKTKINEINSKLNGFLHIDDVTFGINEGKLVYNIDYNIPFSPKEQKISVEADIMYFDNTVYNQSETAKGKSTIMNFLKLTNALNYINPLDFSTKFLQNNNIAAFIKNVYVKDDKVVIEGLLNITR